MKKNIFYQIMAGEGSNQPLEKFKNKERAYDVLLQYSRCFKNAYIREIEL